ncbi:MAG: hypothetical protein B7X37_07590 [Halothiobacillus sp. 14-55-98]|nr:MAG: hypothetical protein B7X37_07590 [Halothiobacillus sp. 14-55-98]
MKPDIHPNYRPVVFQDLASDFSMSSASHPFYTGKRMDSSTAKQVDKFRNRYGKK